MEDYAADSERKTRWKRGPVNWTPTSFSPPDWESQTWTTRPWVAKSASALREGAELPGRREAWCEKGMRISRSEPMATSKRVTKAAPLRQRFSLEVSSSKLMPRESRPRTLSGRRTEILRSERCFDTDSSVAGTMGWVLVSGDPGRTGIDPHHHAGTVLEKALHAFQHFTGCSRRVYVPTKLAAVPNAMRKPASELLHFSHSIGETRRTNFMIVAEE